MFNKLKSICTNERFLQITTCSILLALGFFTGYLYNKNVSKEIENIKFVGEINSYVPYLKIHGIYNGMIIAETKKQPLRIEYNDEILNADANTIFKIYIDKLSNNIEDLSTTATGLNKECLFIASQTGKYGYPIDSAKAKTIKNKKCFATEEEVLDAGLTIYGE